MYVELRDDELSYIIFSRVCLTSLNGIVGASLVRAVKVVDDWDFLDLGALKAACKVVKSVLG